MSTLKKHVGRIRNTDRRCVVVYMEIPGNEENALVVDTDALPDRFHDALMDIIDSTEGQQTLHLHTLLARRILPDLGMDMLNALHTYGQLRSVPIDNVVMYPAPSSPVSLRTIVDYNRAQVATPEEKVVLENRILENQKMDSSEAQLDIARNILQQAQDLENEANRKREQAYRLAPTLRPQVTASPEVTEASVPAEETHVDTAEVIDAPVELSEEQQDYVDEHRASAEGMTLPEPVDTSSEPVLIPELVADPDLPADVLAALEAAHAEMQAAVAPVEEVEDLGNQVDTSDDAVQAFLDRVAHREDLLDKELQASLKDKQPVGRPRKDGLPAGSVKPGQVIAPPPAPKKRGRPPKAKL